MHTTLIPLTAVPNDGVQRTDQRSDVLLLSFCPFHYLEGGDERGKGEIISLSYHYSKVSCLFYVYVLGLYLNRTSLCPSASLLGITHQSWAVHHWLSMYSWSVCLHYLDYLYFALPCLALHHPALYLTTKYIKNWKRVFASSSHHNQLIHCHCIPHTTHSIL